MSQKEKKISKQKIEPAFSIVIVAPHPDDEIIGCHEILRNQSLAITVVYSGNTEAKRREEAMILKSVCPNVKSQMFHNSIPPPLLNLRNTFYMPDPIYENHPEHRGWGYLGESMAREGYNVIFYSVNMEAPYIHHVRIPEEKRNLLEMVYPSQKDLWKYERKYYLFEGYNKWIF